MAGVNVTQHSEYGKAPFEPSVGRGAENTSDFFKTEMGKIFGDKLAVVPTMAYDLDTKSELAHSTTGLKYALRGRATVIEATVGERLATFQDPIKAILPVRVVDSHRIIVTTSEVVGGRALIVPERATARTVSVKKTSREVALERYGGDLEMNLNLMHEAGMFKQELDLKIKAQQRELERVLIEIGYDTLLEGGMRLETAILRSSAAFNGTIDNGGAGMEATRMIMEAARVYNHKCFGVMNKHKWPMQSILSAAKYATAFSIGAPGSTMILPHGLPELLRYGRPEAMTFKINGLKTTDNLPITMDLGTAHTDPATSIKMMTHIPQPTYEYGTANPRVGMGCLSEVVDVLTYFIIPNSWTTAGVGAPAGPGHVTPYLDLVDAKGRCVTRTQLNMSGGPDQAGNNPGTSQHSAYVVIRKTRVAMSSAILAAPGSDTGELLVGMPHTGISTSQTDETMKMQLRVYLGAVLKRPESVVVLPHVTCDGLVSQTGLPPVQAGARAFGVVNTNANAAQVNGMKLPCDNTEANQTPVLSRTAMGNAQANFERWVEDTDAEHDFIISIDGYDIAAAAVAGQSFIMERNGIDPLLPAATDRNRRILPTNNGYYVNSRGVPGGTAFAVNDPAPMQFADGKDRTWDELMLKPESFLFFGRNVSPAAHKITYTQAADAAPGALCGKQPASQRVLDIKNGGGFGPMEDIDKPYRINALDGEFNDLTMGDP